MRRGEALILATMGVVVAGLMARNLISLHSDKQADRGIPFFTTADAALARRAGDLYHDHGCRECHSLWTLKSAFETVPAPALDGIGSLRSEDWFYDYFSSPDPQSILPSRLKPEYRMPSLAALPQEERRILEAKDWYVDSARAAEYEKLTGKEYPRAHAEN